MLFFFTLFLKIFTTLGREEGSDLVLKMYSRHFPSGLRRKEQILKIVERKKDKKNGSSWQHYFLTLILWLLK